jgi:hypothetical protein
MIKLPKNIHDNLQFLSVEIDAQLNHMQLFFEDGSAQSAEKVVSRSGYAYNLKARIHNAVVNQLLTADKNSRTLFRLRSLEFIANDLDRIAELCRNCIKHTDMLESFEGLNTKHYSKLLRKIQLKVKLILPAVEHTDSKLAIEIGQTNFELEQDYKKLLKKNATAIKNNRHKESIAPAIFIAYEFKQMGKALVNICESIISAKLGQLVSFERYFSLQSLVSEMESGQKSFQIKTVAETRSGSAISGISNPETGYMGIYKGGLKQKLKEEKEGVNRWHEIYPGLAPKILAYKKKGESASLLIEHLPGNTFEKIVVNQSMGEIDVAQKQLNKTLRSIWTETHQSKGISAQFMQQLSKRMPEVYAVHPEFSNGASTICGNQILSFSQLIQQAETLEKKWLPPFSVYIHGDFNIDNIIYDPVHNRINFIDLHRSCYMDYVQDISTFMISNYRLQVLDAPRRKRIMHVARAMYAMARRYAVKYDDESFDLRLALGLARSFASSTRFILDKSLAQAMFLRARYLLELALAVEASKVSKFRIPLKEIFVE